ncbi:MULTISPECIES: C40 family peptidase [Bacillales]|uniref:C40 family peptidase n=1 Tax=Lysinibacillus louembei TaxID=1470088 RepID=A0ABZ0RYR6_9BACI|nr:MULTISPECIES: C40 family peptidase [Bacillales]MCT6923350.1 C40 family peptidase [Metasolibacillus sp.]MCT6941018.1 C40 family peptidase [Metasolibacillus sp.]WPK12431.1 C40 family peptidase [Lysinibacillus louembei]
MSYNKILRNTLLTFLAALAIFLSPIGEEKAAAADFTSSNFKSTAQKYLGVPYSYGGTSTRGFDCSGYVRTVFSDLGVSLPRTSSSMYGVGTAVSQNDLIPGDLVFFNTSGSGISHVGIYLGGGKFIHSQTNIGVSVTDINDKWYWGSRYVGAKRVANVSFE